MSISLLEYIKNCTITNRWLNGKVGKFEYSQFSSSYRFIETTEDGYSWVVKEQDRNDENTPIVIKGFIAFLIACWGQNEIAIYNTYNERLQKSFIEIESKKAGSFKRDLVKEFAKQLLKAEQNNIEMVKDMFDYVSVEEKSLLLEYGKNYLEYTASIFKQKLVEPKEYKSFESILHHENKPALMTVLHELLDDVKGKKVAIVIKSLTQLGYLDIPSNRNELYRMLEIEFGYIGTSSNLNNYLNPDSRQLTESVLQPTLVILKKV